MSAQSDMGTFLANQGFGTLGTDLFTAPPKRWSDSVNVPVPSIWVWASGGPAPALSNPDVSMRYNRVNIRVRSDANDYQGGSATAESLWAAVQLAAITGYVEVKNDLSAPAYLGRAEGAGPHEFSLIVSMLV